VACSSPRALSGESFMPLLEVCLKFVEKYKQVRLRLGAPRPLEALLAVCMDAPHFQVCALMIAFMFLESGTWLCPVPAPPDLPAHTPPPAVRTVSAPQSNAEAAVQYLDLLEALVGWLLVQSPAAAEAAAQGGALLDDDAALTGGGSGAEMRACAAEPKSLAARVTLVRRSGAQSAQGSVRCAAPPAADEQLVSLWLTSMGVLAQTLATNECQPLRDSAIMVLG
jgi:hypothetical protein